MESEHSYSAHLTESFGGPDRRRVELSDLEGFTCTGDGVADALQFFGSTNRGRRLKDVESFPQSVQVGFIRMKVSELRDYFVEYLSTKSDETGQDDGRWKRVKASWGDMRESSAYVYMYLHQKEELRITEEILAELPPAESVENNETTALADTILEILKDASIRLKGQQERSNSIFAAKAIQAELEPDESKRERMYGQFNNPIDGADVAAENFSESQRLIESYSGIVRELSRETESAEEQEVAFAQLYAMHNLIKSNLKEALNIEDAHYSQMEERQGEIRFPNQSNVED